jgi:hypothetical protein
LGSCYLHYSAASYYGNAVIEALWSRAVDGNLGDSIIKLKKNILVFLDGFPFSGL